jgi:hypothetical protein
MAAEVESNEEISRKEQRSVGLTVRLFRTQNMLRAVRDSIERLTVAESNIARRS